MDVVDCVVRRILLLSLDLRRSLPPSRFSPYEMTYVDNGTISTVRGKITSKNGAKPALRTAPSLFVLHSQILAHAVSSTTYKR
jgi:hypothetical protein